MTDSQLNFSGFDMSRGKKRGGGGGGGGGMGLENAEKEDMCNEVWRHRCKVLQVSFSGCVCVHDL